MDVRIKSPSVPATVLLEADVEVKPAPDLILPATLPLPRISVTSPTPSPAVSDIKPVIRPKRAIPSHVATKLSFPVITAVPAGCVRRSDKPTLVVNDQSPTPAGDAADVDSDDAMSSAPSDFSDGNDGDFGVASSRSSTDSRSDSGTPYVQDEESDDEEAEVEESEDEYVEDEEVEDEGMNSQTGSDYEEEGEEGEAVKKGSKKSNPRKPSRKIIISPAKAKPTLPTPPPSSPRSGPSSSSTSSRKRAIANQPISFSAKTQKKAKPNGSYVTGTFSSADDLAMYIYRSENPARNWDELAERMYRKSGAVNTHWKIVHKKIIELLGGK